MFNINSNNISKLSLKNDINQHWLDIRDQEKSEDYSQQYAKICQQHMQKKKWILVINPEEKSLDKLTSVANIDTSKILQVNTHKVNVNIKSIEAALAKGNCSAVVLCNASFDQHEISLLTKSAEKGKTQCIVLNNTTTLH